MKFARFRFLLPVLALALPGVLLSLRPGRGQDWLETGINRGAPMVRLAVTEFPAQPSDQRLVNLTQEFNQALRNDLSNAGIFEMISKSNFPLKIPVEPGDVDFKSWTDPPASAQMLAFGKTDRKSTRLNSSHSQISYAVFCLKKKKNNIDKNDMV